MNRLVRCVIYISPISYSCIFGIFSLSNRHTHLHEDSPSRPSAHMGPKHASCLHHLPPHTRHRSYRLHQRRVCQRPGGLHDLPYTRGVVILRALRTGSISWTSPGRHHLLRLRARLHQPPRRQHLLDVTRPPPRLPSSSRRRGSPLHCAAAALLFIVPPVVEAPLDEDDTQVEN